MRTKHNTNALRSRKLTIALAALLVFVMGFCAYAYADEGNTPASSVSSSEGDIATSNFDADDSKELEGNALLGNADALSKGDPVYVNGSTGDDSNPGTKAKPVKTFAKAKELMEKYGSDIIWVTGMLSLSDATETWDLGGKMMMRDSDYHGELVRITDASSLTLTNIVIDGGVENGAYGQALADSLEGYGGSLVSVFDSTLTISTGAKLQNNKVINEGHWYPEAGGAVFAMSATVNVNGGVISGNAAVYGGGIAAMNSSTVNVTAGEISGNEATFGECKNVTREYSGHGGGICVYVGSQVNMSGGVISGNSAFENGGGIAVGVFTVFNNKSSVLNMTGGTIDGNKAGAVGGGIYIQAGYKAEKNNGVPTQSIAYISAGDITNNSVTGEGYGSHMFGGGGIYVNGVNSTVFQNGELYLENVEVSNNTAGELGGGFAACPTTQTEVNLANGAVFYGNKTTKASKAREIYVIATNLLGQASKGDPTYKVSPSMLGGGAYKWVSDDGTEVSLDKLAGTLKAANTEQLRLSNSLDSSDAGVQKAVSLAKVHITGNSAPQYGGGIGSNGSVFIGKTVDTTEVSVSKSWNDANDKDELRPESVTIELYRDGEYVGFQTVKPDDKGEWKTSFTELPKVDADGHEYAYTVKERDVEGYKWDVAGDAATGIEVCNTRVTSVDVTKKWVYNENGDSDHPTSVTVNLLRDGEKFDSATIEADEDGNWSYSFTGLAKYDSEDGHEYAYTVEESTVEGFESKVEGSAADGFVITNTEKEKPPIPDEPENPDEPDDSDEPETEPDSPSTNDKDKTGKSNDSDVTPKTGDSNSVLPVGLAAAAALACGVCARRRSNRGSLQENN